MEKNKGGRPSKYKPSMCAKAVEMMSEGASKTEVCAAIDITRETLSEWIDPKSLYYIEEFSCAIKKGQRLSEAWWEKMARENLIAHPKGPQLNATLWYMNMKNRFGWKDKQEVEHSGEVKQTVSIDAGPNPYAAPKR